MLIAFVINVNTLNAFGMRVPLRYPFTSGSPEPPAGFHKKITTSEIVTSNRLHDRKIR